MLDVYKLYFNNEVHSKLTQILKSKENMKKFVIDFNLEKQSLQSN